MTRSISPTSSRLAKAKRGRLSTPVRYLIYSPEGVGKSTLAADAPRPIFLDIEGGTAHIDAVRYPFGDGDDGHVPTCYEDVIAALDDLAQSEHDYRTVVIDTVDRLEALLWDAICRHYSGRKHESYNKRGDQIDHIESFGYGKGYAVALQWWRSLCVRLDDLRTRRGMTVVLLGHAQIRTFKNPAGEDFDRYQLRLHQKAGDFLREWCDVVGFAAFEDALRAENNRTKATETGARLLHLERTAAYDAKTRIPLPSEIELSVESPWAPLAAAIDEGRAATPDDMRARIARELDRISDPALVERVMAAVNAAGDDAATLSRYVNNLKSRQSAQKDD